MARHDPWGTKDILANTERQTLPVVEVVDGTPLTHRDSRFVGTVGEFSQGNKVMLIDRYGTERAFAPDDGAFLHRGIRVALRTPGSAPREPLTYTASGSVDMGPSRARVARASRIWVEGIHDAELLEKVWGDDLRIEGIVVEPLHGADDLKARVDAFQPGANRRLGVLLDHLVVGSKESLIAQSATHAGVLIVGHPYVDVWQAVKPKTIGIANWPEVPRGTPWKQGIIDRLGIKADPGHFWRQILESVSSYRDLESPLVNAVEQLIDFVAVDDNPSP